MHVRARYRFAWETALRPETVGRLRVPDHFAPGSAELRLDDADEKARFGRLLPMTPATLAILAAVAPAEGLVFGWHCFDKALNHAATAVLGAERG